MGYAAERVQRHAVEQLADFAPMVQILDLPVPQMVDQLVDVLKLLDTAIPEHVIAVPKIPHHAAFEPQLAEQLVEVPTAVTFVPGTFRRSLWTRMGPSPGAHWVVLLERRYQLHPAAQGGI